jgi:tripartite-type tricarboxylate transporter receptor subunit TctC
VQETKRRVSLKLNQSSFDVNYYSLKHCIFIIASLLLMNQAWTQNYPRNAVHVILPFPAGGGVDAAGRILSQRLTETMGKPFVIDNKGGANGNIGTEQVAKSLNDGYTLLFTGAGFVINPSLYKRVGYDAIKDFEPISMMAIGPNVLVVHPSLPVHNVQELIALAKNKPGEIGFAGSGNGSTPHLAGVLFNLMADVQLIHVPYKGSGPAIVGLIAGEVPVMFLPAINAGQLISSGRVRGIAVTSKERLSSFPELPTVSSAGLTGYESNQWYGILAPHGTPVEILNTLSAQVKNIMQTSEMQLKMKADGLIPVGSSKEQFSAYIKTELDKWAKVVASSGATID